MRCAQWRAAMVLAPADATQQVDKSVAISVEVSMSRTTLFGSTRLYFKKAPTDSVVDTCNYSLDAEANVIHTYLSVSGVEDTADGPRVGMFVAPNPPVHSSVCLVQFMASSTITRDMAHA